jgi:hypothetical protein
VVSFTPRPLYSQGKSPRYPLDRRLGGPQSRSGRGGEEKNSQPPPREPNSSHLIYSLVTILTELSWLSSYQCFLDTDKAVPPILPHFILLTTQRSGVMNSTYPCIFIHMTQCVHNGRQRGGSLTDRNVNPCQASKARNEHSNRNTVPESCIINPK